MRVAILKGLETGALNLDHLPAPHAGNLGNPETGGLIEWQADPGK